MQGVGKLLEYGLPAAAPALYMQFAGGGMDFEVAAIAGGAALAGVMAGSVLGAVGGTLKVTSKSTKFVVQGVAAGVAAGAALVFLQGQDIAGVAPLVGATALAGVAGGFIQEEMAKKN